MKTLPKLNYFLDGVKLIITLAEIGVLGILKQKTHGQIKKITINGQKASDL